MPEPRESPQPEPQPLVRALRLVSTVAALANESTTTPDAAGAVLRPICEQGAWDCAHAYLPIASERLAMSHSFAPAADAASRALCEASRETDVKPGGLIARAFAALRPLWTTRPAAELDARRGRLAEELGFRTVAVLPLVHGGRVYGALEFFARAERTLGAVDIEELACIGAVLGGVAARQEAERKLRHSERLVSLGTFAAGIAHEINNPLASILMAARFALKRPGAPEDVAQILHEIVDDTERCARIVRNVQRVARKLPSDRTRQELNRIVESAAVFGRKYAEREDRQVAFELTRDPLPVQANAAEIEQVCISLITNAVQASGAGQTVNVRTTRLDTKARLLVEDHGRGMTDEEHRHAFDLFYTTRDREGGTGLGLALAYGIVSDHGGSIEILTREGHGSSVLVDLPLLAANDSGETDPCEVSGSRQRRSEPRPARSEPRPARSEPRP